MADEYETDNEYETDDEYEGADEHEDEADADGSCGDKRGYRYVLEVPKSMTPPPFRLVELKAGQDLDPREIVVVPFLHYARGCAGQCPSRACRQPASASSRRSNAGSGPMPKSTTGTTSYRTGRGGICIRR